jgi:hypothetical protein
MSAVEFIKPLYKKKPSKLHVVLLAPILAIVFMLGWSLYCIGQTNQSKASQPQKQIKKTHTNQNEIELFVIPQQEQIIAI